MAMNITLSPKQEAGIRARVYSGRYASASDVVGCALKLLDNHERGLTSRHRLLTEQLAIAYREIDSEDTRVFEKEEVERLKAACRSLNAGDERGREERIEPPPDVDREG
jgi:putative addiction module CopG family antidote